MKKTISTLLVMIMCIATFALTGCGNETGNNNGGDSKASIESAQAFYTKVWEAYGENNKFACAGGDADHTAEAPGEFMLTDANAETFKYLLHVTDDLYNMLDNDVSTLQHMMNTNTYCSAVAKLKDSSKASEFAEAYKTAVQQQRWMCGFPDKVVVISVGDYVVMAYGSEDNIKNLVTACTTVEASSKVLIDAPATLE